MRKVIIPLFLSVLIPLLWGLGTSAFSSQIFSSITFLNQVLNCLSLVLILFMSDLYMNGFSFKDPEVIIYIDKLKYEELLKNQEIILNDGNKIPFIVKAGKIKGWSPFNLVTFKSFFEIVPKKSKINTLEIVVKVKSWSFIQVFDFGYNSRLLRSISEAIV